MVRLLQLDGVHLLAELAFTHFPAALLRVAAVLAGREGNGRCSLWFLDVDGAFAWLCFGDVWDFFGLG